MLTSPWSALGETLFFFFFFLHITHIIHTRQNKTVLVYKIYIFFNVLNSIKVFLTLCTSRSCHCPQDGIRRKLLVPFAVLFPFLATTPLPQPEHQIRAHLSWAHALSHAFQPSHAAALANGRAPKDLRGIHSYGEGRDTEGPLLQPAWSKQRLRRGEKQSASETSWHQ